MKIESIIDPSFKTGTGKKGQWTLVKVAVDGKTAIGFAPISVGDEVDLEYNDEYKNWNFKKLGPQDIPSVQANDLNDNMKLLGLIYEDVQKILKIIDTSGYDKAKATAKAIKGEDVVADYDPNEEPDLSAIPL